jgi:hypothetical protein
MQLLNQMLRNSFIIALVLFGNLVHAVPVSVRSLQISKSASMIQLDGILDEPSWQLADMAGNFQQRYPADTSQAFSKTEVRLTYDDDFLYIGAICYDDLEGDYIVESLRRDYEAQGNDALDIIIDPHNDLINGFLFGITPFGVQRESLIINGGGDHHDENASWDNKWFSEVTRHDDHWIAEIAIPFNTLRYKEGVDKWRINFVRVDYKQNEYSNWNWIPRNFSSTSLAYTGELKWDKPLMENSRNIAFIPYASAGAARDYEEGDPAHFIKGFGADAKIGLTSSMNLDLTVNPDFSQVEVDQQVTNLDRFEIFFPEKRQFFLENSDIFDEFGYQDRSNAIRPFFSRRIGIAEDTSLNQHVQNPIYLGARLSGRINENWRVGLMSMQAADDPDIGLPSINYSVAAVQRRVFSRSNIAAIFVNKDPISSLSEEPDSSQVNSFNRVAGIEYNLASMDNRWIGKVFYHQSFGPEKMAAPYAHGASLAYNNEHWDISWSHALVGEDFNAEVGFVRRKGYKRISPSIGYDFYPASKILNRHGPSFSYEGIWDMGNNKIDESFGLRYMLRFNNQMYGYVSASRDYILLTDDFDPTRSDGPELLEGTDYYNNYIRYFFRSDLRRALSFDVRGRMGEYYNGKRFEAEGDMNFRFRPYGVISLNFSYNKVRLPEPYHSADLYLIGPKIDLTFTRTLYFATLVQYNSQINNINVNARIQWRYKPASDIYLVYTDNYFADVFKSKNRALVFKITYWLNV